MPHVGVALMPEPQFLEAVMPLIEAGDVGAVEWSYDTGWKNGISDWLVSPRSPRRLKIS